MDRDLHSIAVNIAIANTPSIKLGYFLQIGNNIYCIINFFEIHYLVTKKHVVVGQDWVKIQEHGWYSAALGKDI